MPPARCLWKKAISSARPRHASASRHQRFPSADAHSDSRVVLFPSGHVPARIAGRSSASNRVPIYSRDEGPVPPRRRVPVAVAARSLLRRIHDGHAIVHGPRALRHSLTLSQVTRSIPHNVNTCCLLGITRRCSGAELSAQSLECFCARIVVAGCICTFAEEEGGGMVAKGRFYWGESPIRQAGGY